MDARDGEVDRAQIKFNSHAWQQQPVFLSLLPTTCTTGQQRKYPAGSRRTHIEIAHYADAKPLFFRLSERVPTILSLSS